MDADRLMTQDGMREYRDEQTATWLTDATQVDTMAQLLQARISETLIEGDRRGAAKRRARKIAKRFRKASQHVRRAAAEIEAADAVLNREIVDLPARRQRELQRKRERDEERARLRGLAKTQIVGALAESAHGFNTNAQVVPPMPQHAPLHNAQPFAMPQSVGSAPLGEITDHFPSMDLPEAL